MKTIEDIVNDSGYPLQLHNEELINKSRKDHQWRVLAREHRWVNKKNEILENISPTIKWRFVIECKRRNGSWTFLLPPPKHFNLTNEARILKTEIDDKNIIGFRQVFPLNLTNLLFVFQKQVVIRIVAH